MGFQVFDRNGRASAILPLRRNAARVGILFGGHGFDTLYVSDVGGKLYCRKMKVSGLEPGGPRIKLSGWSAGVPD
jgi:hypothetical protein